MCMIVSDLSLVRMSKPVPYATAKMNESCDYKAISFGEWDESSKLCLCMYKLHTLCLVNFKYHTGETEELPPIDYKSKVLPIEPSWPQCVHVCTGNENAMPFLSSLYKKNTYFDHRAGYNAFVIAIVEQND